MRVFVRSWPLLENLKSTFFLLRSMRWTFGLADKIRKWFSLFIVFMTFVAALNTSAATYSKYSGNYEGERLTTEILFEKESSEDEFFTQLELLAQSQGPLIENQPVVIMLHQNTLTDSFQLRFQELISEYPVLAQSQVIVVDGETEKDQLTDTAGRSHRTAGFALVKGAYASLFWMSYGIPLFTSDLRPYLGVLYASIFNYFMIYRSKTVYKIIERAYKMVGVVDPKVQSLKANVTKFLVGLGVSSFAILTVNSIKYLYEFPEKILSPDFWLSEFGVQTLASILTTSSLKSTEGWRERYDLSDGLMGNVVFLRDMAVTLPMAPMILFNNTIVGDISLSLLVGFAALGVSFNFWMPKVVYKLDQWNFGRMAERLGESVSRISQWPLFRRLLGKRRSESCDESLE